MLTREEKKLLAIAWAVAIVILATPAVVILVLGWVGAIRTG